MHISPPLLLLMLVIFVFFPSIQEWNTQGGIEWYRPYQLWFGIIIAIWWVTRRYQQAQTTSQAKKDQDSNEP